jgi:hypothetical protein
VEDGGSFDFEAASFTPLEDPSTLLLTDDFSSSEGLEHPFAFATDTQNGQSHDDMSWADESMSLAFNDNSSSSGSSTWASCDPIASTSSSPPPGQSSEFCYICLVRIMRTHEGVEAAAWAQKKRVRDMNDTLQEQKKAMIECSGLLDCPKCSRQPAHIMLLLSICGKILGTLEAIYCSLGARVDVNAGAPAYQMHPKRRWSEFNGVVEINAPLNQRPVYGMGSSKRQLDDEDTLLVTKSLLTARVNMLDALINRLDIVSTTHSWPAHQSLTQDLQDRLNKGLLAITRGT